MSNFACIKIRVLCITGSLCYYKSTFRRVHIQETGMFKNRELRENMSRGLDLTYLCPDVCVQD